MDNRLEGLSDPFFPKEILERFLRYARIGTSSDRHVEAIPSTARQWDLIRLLREELDGLGLRDRIDDEHGYTVARVPASPGLEGRPCVGFMAHVDTASDVPGLGVEPRVHKDYAGADIALDGGTVISPRDFPDLADREGDTLITSSGTTLLGADDKAGLSEIMAVAAWLQAHPEETHGPLELIFTPDEETGKGLDLFKPEWLRSVACYTMDGGKLGEVESECFNAWEAKASFQGSVIHIGTARGKLANATAMAADFISGLPRSESPESTDGWYGYYCPIETEGNLEKASATIYLRDFSLEGMDRRIETLKALAAATKARFPGGSVELAFKKQYLNMREKLEARPEVMLALEKAAAAAGVETFSKPIRGGTDGSRLTEMGIPTPNVFTGGYNFHSVREWASLSEMVLAARTLLHLVRAWATAN
jgi:tripeptide aminopeptidase